MYKYFPARRRRDSGMTLPELLIGITLTGMLVAVITSAIIVTLRQNESTTGRLNLSRAEQSIGMWLPNDLASADSFTKNPGASPCGAPQCGDIDLSQGSNVLMLTWAVDIAEGEDVATRVTNVSYHFAPGADGETFVLRRIECTQTDGGWSCEAVTLLGDFPGPPAGVEWIPGVANGAQCAQAGGTVPCTEPDWVIEVSVPLRADATADGEENYATGDQVKDANRVMVTIDGGGGDSEASGGRTKVSITAGGTNREIIAADSLLGAPSFVEARSRCGGPLTLVVDESLSIDIAGASNAVLDSVRAFAETLVGTPVQLQIVEFEEHATVVGATSGQWHRYFDMTDIDGDVEMLIFDTNASGPNDGGFLDDMAIGDMGGDTNWEDGLFRAFYGQDGTTPDDYPETVVFFTDGAPTADRQMPPSGSRVFKTGGDLDGQTTFARPPYATYQGGVYNQASFNRAGYVATANRTKTRLIGVGVGGINDNITWVTNPGSGYAFDWERGSGRYYMATTTYQTNRTNFQVGTAFSSNLDYEYRAGSSWNSNVQDVSPDTYFTNNSGTNHTGQSDSDRYRILRSNNNWSTRSGTNTPMGFNAARRYVNEIGYFNSTNNFKVTTWGTSSAAAYKAASTTERDRLYRYTSTGWTDISQADYNAGNIDSSENDGFRVGTTYTWLTQAQYDAGVTSPAPNTTYHTVAKRFAPNNSVPPLTEANAPDWEAVSSPYGSASQQLSNETNATDGYRATRVYPTSPPAGGYLGYTPAQTSSKTGAKILANLVAGDDTGTPYVANPDNSQIANMYVLPPANQGGFNKLKDALKAVALGECGGTLTVRTQLESGAVARDPFTYQRSAAWESAGPNWNNTGASVTIEQSVVKTNQQYPAGTFDFTIDGGTGVKVLVSPQNFDELGDYQPVGWSCRAGITPLVQGVDFGVLPVLDDEGDPTGWSSIQVNIGANQAVACTQTVRLT